MTHGPVFENNIFFFFSFVCVCVRALLHVHVHVGGVGRFTYIYVYSSMWRPKDRLCCCSSGAVQLFTEAGSLMSLEHIKYTRLWALGIHLPPPHLPGLRLPRLAFITWSLEIKLRTLSILPTELFAQVPFLLCPHPEEPKLDLGFSLTSRVCYWVGKRI